MAGRVATFLIEWSRAATIDCESILRTMTATQSQFPVSRRDFLATTASAALASSLTSVSGQSISANERVRLGVIGIGPRCKQVLNGMLSIPEFECVAIADVQQVRREEGKAHVDGLQDGKPLKLYRDFRAVLDRDDIDAVLIATGDRWHADASILAADAGKDVYSEKPCGITIDACQRLSAGIKRNNRVFQAGTQRRNVSNFQKAISLAQQGKLGKLHTLHASIYEPVLANHWAPAQPQPSKEVCDWNMWLGPAAWRPYNEKYVRGGWRRQWDFDSGGALLDWGAHTLDLCQWANQSDDTMPIEYEPFEDKIVCHYASGVTLILDFLETPFGDRSPHYITRLGTCPVRFEGERGSIETGDSGEIVVKPEGLANVDLSEKPNGLLVTGHALDFLNAIKTRGRTRCNEDVMRRSHIACHAAALSWILGRKLTIDPETETFVDDADANRLRSRPSREWTIS